VRAPPEPLLTLEEACQRYFPGKSACALRWMIKRRGYAHSRWGREYRLTPSQVAAIVDDLARPANLSHTDTPGPSAAPRRARPAARASQAQQLRAPPYPGVAKYRLGRQWVPGVGWKNVYQRRSPITITNRPG
jgi:hypothetical protein